MRAMHDAGQNYCLFNFAVGNPEKLELWQYLRPALAEMRDGDVLGWHSYWGTDPTNTWHVARWEHATKWAPELETVPIVANETGRDRVEQTGAPGWRKGGISRELYLHEIDAASATWSHYPNFRGGALFTNGTENDPRWSAYDCAEVWPAIREAQGQPVKPLPQPGLWPVKGEYHVSQRFGDSPWLYKEFGLQGHNGTDLVCEGQPHVFSMSDGYLKQGYDPCGYGLYAYIENRDEGTAWVYGHLAWCRETGPVRVGDVIGSQGYSGRTVPGGDAGAHVHVGMRRIDGHGRVIDVGNGYRGYVDWTLTYPEPK